MKYSRKNFKFPDPSINTLNAIDNMKDKPVLAVIGDSQARDLYNALIESNMFKDYQKVTVFVPTECQINFDADRMNFIKESAQKTCKDNKLKQIVSVTERADVIIFASLWQEWSARRISAQIATIEKKESSKKANRKIFIMGRKTFAKVLPSRQLLNMATPEKQKLTTEYNAFNKKINQILRTQFKGETFIDILDLLQVQNNGQIPYTTENGFIISFDSAHWTQAGALYIGKILAKKSVLSIYGQ